MAALGVLRIALAVFIIFSIKKLSLNASNSVCYSLYPEETTDLQETYICSSLWELKRVSVFNPNPRHALKFLLLLAGDVELCPGPRVSCNGCLKAIYRSQPSNVCESCEILFHTRCLTDKLERGKDKFYCSLCLVNTEPDLEKDCRANVRLYPELSSDLRRKGLKILHLNANGILSKLEQIRILLTETNRNAHVLKITETHLDTSVPDSLISISGYTNTRRDRSNGPGGGLCIYIRNDLNWQRRYDLEKDEIEMVVIEIFIKCAKSLILSAVYRPPDSSKYLNRDFNFVFNDSITTILSENKEFILSGDMNCDFLKEPDHRDIKDCLKMNGFKQLIEKPTRVTQHSSTLIDVVFTTHENNIASQFVHSLGISDHHLVGIIRKLNVKSLSLVAH